MTTHAWEIATLAAALGSGLVAGIFYAFSTFVMAAFATLSAANGIRAMTAINRVIINPWFLLLFFGVAIAALALAIRAAAAPSPGGAAVLAGALCYLAGTILVTLAFNVPRNNALDRAEPESEAGAAYWARYLREWTFWNHVRTAASLAAALLFTLGWAEARG